MSYSTDKHDVPIPTKEEWLLILEDNDLGRSNMNHLIMNYLVTEGFKEAAEKFQQESGVIPTVELHSLDDRIRIRDAIMTGRIQEATALINQLHPELLDNDRYLYFHLQQLHLIELIRNNRIEEALAFAQSHLSEAGEEDPSVLSELERTVALLAFEEPLASPFGDLLAPSHRQKVASEVNAAILKMEHQENTAPKISTLLKLILWAQEKLNKKNVKYPKIVDLATAHIEDNK
ncbi:glucose-induced degradation protein 8-A homolog [Diorhabda carinulata]|uniref:glucose-induced degradation protein 8-A homolog n=1 Tax=Diorhabda sublineata TaxID=1163346 RepID=UPI0024E15139|nr:glucose-induced degradation protein 8-A homolog [Diorhabda sublineata]XP_057660051.1 glucose-induced degradation protein 8-A homolog [Diorhabda carinulata]XP_057660052.1 glucose-induced degradation protein 8-A homolog [Diorhabda carinulata]XP_057660053.1 glucose-induced degradation protein 8-A homolog [Diorhabda carinulata]